MERRVTVDSDTSTRDGTRAVALWTGVLLGPVASLLALEVSYVLAERACATGRMAPVHLTLLGCFLLATAGGLLARREWGRWRARPEREQGGPEGRSRFLALLGMLSSGIFALTIVVQWTATWFYHPCQ
jgi:hypothetical protein